MAQQQLKLTPRPDIRILIDISGSMLENDPRNMRVPSARLLVNLFPENARVGIYLFGDGVETLVPPSLVNDAWRKQALRAVENIHARGTHTDIGGALQRVSEEWFERPRGLPTNRSIIILTDGMIDISRRQLLNEQAREEITSDIIPRLKSIKARVYGIGLSTKADKALLRELANNTDGFYKEAKTATELQESFYTIFKSAVKRDTIPIKHNKFLVDNKVKEFSVMVFHAFDAPKIKLRSPDFNIHDENTTSAAFNWQAEPNFDLITVKNPMPGKWKIINNTSRDNNVFVVSDVKLRVKNLPKNVFVYENFILKAVFAEKGIVIQKPDFLKVLQVHYSKNPVGKKFLSRNKISLYDDGIEDDAKKHDGIFSGTIGFDVNDVGTRDILVVADGPTISRQSVQTVTVHATPVRIEERRIGQDGDHQIFIEPIGDLVDNKSVKIRVKVTDPSNRIEFHKLNSQADETRWVIKLPALSGDDYRYLLEVNVRGKTVSGRDFEVTTAPQEVRKGALLKPEVADLQVSDESFEEQQAKIEKAQEEAAKQAELIKLQAPVKRDADGEVVQAFTDVQAKAGIKPASLGAIVAMVSVALVTFILLAIVFMLYSRHSQARRLAKLKRRYEYGDG